MKFESALILLAVASLSLSAQAEQPHHSHGHGQAHDHAMSATAEEGAGPYEVRAIFLGYDETEHRITAAHEAIPGVMMAMRMHLALPEEEPAPQLEPGDKVVFQMFSRIEAGQRWYVQGLERLPEETELALPAELREAVGH